MNASTLVQKVWNLCLKDDGLENLDDLPPPDVLKKEIIEYLEAALAFKRLKNFATLVLQKNRLLLYLPKVHFMRDCWLIQMTAGVFNGQTARRRPR